MNHSEGASEVVAAGNMAVSETDEVIDPLSTEREMISAPANDARKVGHPTSAPPTSPQGRRRLGIDSLVFTLAALLSLVFGVVQGFIPLFFILGALFGLLALISFLKHPLSEALRATMLSASLLLAGVLGAAINQDAFGVHYRYLSQGSAQYRVDEKAGRTDRLETNGWVPVAYDKPAQPLPMNTLGAPVGLTLGSGSWIANGSNGTICFTAENSSGIFGDSYVIDRILIYVSLQNKSTASQVVTLKSETGFLQPGDTESVCSPGPPDMYGGHAPWTYSSVSAYGWKR